MPANRVHRLLRLILLMQGSRARTVNELASELGVSRRTLFRDLNLLELAGIPYHHDEVEGYRLGSHFYLPPVNLTVPETLGLMLMGKAASAQRGKPLFDSALAAIAKLTDTVPEPIRDACGDLLDRVSFDPGATTVSPSENKHYISFQQCIDEGRSCRIVYQTAPTHEGVIECVLRPYLLHFSARAWYVMGWTDLHKEVRVFKLGRVISVAMLEEKFEKPAGFRASDKLGKAWQMVPEGKVYDVVVEFSARVATNVAEVRWHPTQRRELLPDGRCRLLFEVDGLGEVAWWLCGYADQVKVIEPAALRERVKTMLKNALTQYEQ